MYSMVAAMFILGEKSELRPCDLYAHGGSPCVAAHSLTRALFAAYDGPLYKIQRLSDNQTKDIYVDKPGGIADAGAHQQFCMNSVCALQLIFDQSPQGNSLGVAHGAANWRPPRNMQDRAVNFSDPRARVMLGNKTVYSAVFNTFAGYRNGWH